MPHPHSRHSVEKRNPAKPNRLHLYLMLLWIPAFAGMTTPTHAATCTNPNGVGGEIIFNVDHKVLQYCNTDKWIGIGWKNKLAAGTTGQLQFNNDGTLDADPLLFWNNTQKRLGVNTNSPEFTLDVRGYARFYSGGPYTAIRLGADLNDTIASDNNNDYGNGLFFRVHNESWPNKYINMMVLAENGNTGIRNIAPKATLDIGGYMRLAANLTQPEACTANNRGAIALTSTHQMCICTASGWRLANTTIACTW